jgi:tetratricopeptide (TPR) repeat protein
MRHRGARRTAAILTGLALALIAPAAWAQTLQQDHDWCYSPTASDDQTIEGCTAMIQSGQGTSANQADYYDARAFGYVGKGLYDQAIADETQAIALNPDSATAHNTRGSAYDDKGLYDQAIADYSAAIALKPGYAHAYSNRGAAYDSKGLNDRAIADYRAALAIDPGIQQARDGLKKLGATP